MADQLDNRPVFTIVMGCNGAGKSAWKRAHYDLLPDLFFDQDSIAGGMRPHDAAAAIRPRSAKDRDGAPETARDGQFRATLTTQGHIADARYAGRI